MKPNIIYTINAWDPFIADEIIRRANYFLYSLLSKYGRDSFHSVINCSYVLDGWKFSPSMELGEKVWFKWLVKKRIGAFTVKCYNDIRLANWITNEQIITTNDGVALFDVTGAYRVRDGKIERIIVYNISEASKIEWPWLREGNAIWSKYPLFYYIKNARQFLVKPSERK